MQLHRHALSNSKRGVAVDENGKLDDEISVISSEVSTLCTNCHECQLTCVEAKPEVLQ
jgi:hypothetical protein